MKLIIVDAMAQPASNMSNPQQQKIKSSLRLQKRNQRRSLGQQQQRQASQSLNRMLGRDPLFIRARDVVFYFASDGEIDPILLLNRAHKMRKRCYLPVVAASNRLYFCRYQPGDKLFINQFGIPEPVSKIPHKSWQQCLILLPLVAFDRQGNRLGMGGGFYDRSLARIKNRPAKKPVLLGLAHHCQEVEQLPVESWDIPLAGIVTDLEFIKTE